MPTSSLPEVWLRGPLPAIPPLLQPCAHALLQAQVEITELMKDFPESLLWKKPAGLASPGFHLQHLRGVLNRLLSYAEGNMLTQEQVATLQAEGAPNPLLSSSLLVSDFQNEVENFLSALKNMKEETLLQPRGVGRAQLPSTILGLLFHAAEHTMRHTGQLLVTVNVLKAQL